MEGTFSVVVVMAILMIVILGMVLKGAHIVIVKLTMTMREAVQAQAAELEKMREAISLIAASKRLSTYLAIERKEGSPVDPDQFEANKPVLEARMLAELDEQIRRERTDDNPNLAAIMILDNSGFEHFVQWKVKEGIKTALARLLTNKDFDGARQFIRDTVAAL